MTARRALSGIRAPDEAGAQDRAWTVVHSAYLDRGAAVRRPPRRGLVLVPLLVVLAGALALALSPAGAAVSRWISRTLGISHAAPALFSLPAPGRLLVSGPDGTWTVAADGSARRLGRWSQASWSPRGRYIATAARNQLTVIDPRGTPRWTLSRPAVSDARWYPPTGYRIAYFSGHDLRVVAGDGTGDHLLTAGAAPVAPAWRPDHPYELAYVDRLGRTVVRNAGSGRMIWISAPATNVQELGWSADGKDLLVVTRSHALVYDGGGRVSATIAMPPGTTIRDAALSPDARMLALVRDGADTDVELASLGNPSAGGPQVRRVLSEEGLRQLAWSPDGRWLVVSWPVADQWVFVRVAGKPRIDAVSRIRRQFGSGSSTGGFPRIEGWCCLDGQTGAG